MFLSRRVNSLASRSVSRQIRAQPFRRTFAETKIETEPVASIKPPPGGVRSKWSSFLRGLGRVTLVTLAGSAGAFYYFTQKGRHPGTQLPYDPSKKTVVVLGSGWGATSFLKTVDTTEYNVVVISPKNYFLFTPLLPSVAVGTLSPRSILQPTRYITRHKEREVAVIEAEAQEIDPINKTVTLSDNSEIRGAVSNTQIPYDYLVYAVGAEVQTFGIPGVQEHACFMKEMHDAEKMQTRLLDCIETAAFPGQSAEEIERLMHIVVVGGGPTGIEVSGEMHDFLEEDLKAWYPELAANLRISLVEALPSVLPMFSKQLISYTESTFKESKIDILTNTMVKEVKPNSVVLQMPDKSIKDVPCGLVVWAGGNKGRAVTQKLMAQLPSVQTNKRGITVDDYLQMVGTDGSIFAIGDCTSTSYAPTAQVASQQGAYLARVLAQFAKRDKLQSELQANGADAEETEKALSKIKLKPFHYSHQGSLAYVGSDKAIADLPFLNGSIATAGVATYLFWRSAYISTLFSLRNRTLVANDWLITKVFGRDTSRE